MVKKILRENIMMFKKIESFLRRLRFYVIFLSMPISTLVGDYELLRSATLDTKKIYINRKRKV